MTGHPGTCAMPTGSRWTVIRELPRRNGRPFCVARCACGTEREVNLDNIRHGNSLSCGCLLDRGRPRENYEDRFWAKVDRRGACDCWPWTGSLKCYGYGRFWDSDRQISLPAHRVAFELLIGPIPAGMTIDHLCRTKSCVNPAHMEPVTREENSRRQFMTPEQVVGAR